MIRSLYSRPDGSLRSDLDPGEFSDIIVSGEGTLWVDFQGNPPEVDEPVLRDVFNFHPLAIDDALQESHVPKVDDWGKYLYIVVHSVTFDPKLDDDVQTRELDIFLGRTYIVTHHDQSINALERVWTVLQRDNRHLLQGPDHVLYLLTDEVAASYLPVIDDLDDEIDQLEDRLFDGVRTDTLERIFILKRVVLHLRRILGPQREVMNKLARDDYAVIDARDRIYFRDVYDHLVRMHDITESIRDLISGTLDTYLSVINNRMNDIMKTLTIITTFFMPISFIASFFGMNFFEPVAGLTSWTRYPVFIVILLITLLTPSGMYIWMRRRGWF